MNNQPDWKIAGFIGDTSPVDYGGGIVLTDRTGEHDPDIEIYQPTMDNKILVYRFACPRLARTPTKRLVPASIMEDVYRPPYPLAWYEVWFARCIRSDEQLIQHLTHDNPVVVGQGYYYMGLELGFDNFDYYPLSLTPRQAYRRLQNWKKYNRPIKRK